MSADNATWEYCDPRRVTFTHRKPWRTLAPTGLECRDCRLQIAPTGTYWLCCCECLPVCGECWVDHRYAEAQAELNDGWPRWEL